MSKRINNFRGNNQKTKKKSAISVVSLSSYTTPEIIETNNKEWVEFGADNNFFQYLIDRFNGSTTNGAVINGIAPVSYTHLTLPTIYSV